MKYFKLYSYCRYESDKEFGCIYNMDNGQMIKLDHDKSIKLTQAENNELIDENDDFFLELHHLKLGDFYENPIYVEKTRFGSAKEVYEVLLPYITLNRVYIQLTNDCDCTCDFCSSENKIFTKTRCKKWSNKEEQIDVGRWNQILEQLHTLGADTIVFIGGNPLQEYKKLTEIVGMANEKGFSNYIVYTNGILLDNEKIAFFEKNNIAINLQIISLSPAKCEEYNMPYEDLMESIELLGKSTIGAVASILIGKHNEDEVEDIIAKLQKLGIKYIKNDYIYNYPENEYYSKRYVSSMYQRVFGTMSKEGFAITEMYNSCLFAQVSINVSGDITPCPMMNKEVIGNIKKDEIADILNSDKYQEFISTHRGKIEKCGSCAFRLNCMDCRAIEMAATNNLYGQKFCSRIGE